MVRRFALTVFYSLRSIVIFILFIFFNFFMFNFFYFSLFSLSSRPMFSLYSMIISPQIYSNVAGNVTNSWENRLLRNIKGMTICLGLVLLEVNATGRWMSCRNGCLMFLLGLISFRLGYGILCRSMLENNNLCFFFRK